MAGQYLMPHNYHLALHFWWRVVGKDEGNGKSGKRDGDGNKERNCKEEGDGEQRQQQDNGNWDNNDNHNNNINEYNNNNNYTDIDNEDNDKDGNNNNAVAVASGGFWWRGRATNAAAAGVKCSYFYQNWILGVVGGWRGAGKAGRELSRTYLPRKVDTRRN